MEVQAVSLNSRTGLPNNWDLSVMEDIDELNFNFNELFDNIPEDNTVVADREIVCIDTPSTSISTPTAESHALAKPLEPGMRSVLSLSSITVKARPASSKLDTLALPAPVSPVLVSDTLPALSAPPLSLVELMLENFSSLNDRARTANLNLSLDGDLEIQPLMDEILLWLDTTLNIDSHVLLGESNNISTANSISVQIDSLKRERLFLEKEYNTLLTVQRMRHAIGKCEQNITEQLLRMNFNPHSSENRKTRDTESEEDSASPERREARDVLMNWLFQHTRNPYPTITEKDVFVEKTGLSIKQINYWFINARRRVIPRLQEQGMLPEETLDNEVSEMDAVNNWYKRPNLEDE